MAEDDGLQGAVQALYAALEAFGQGDAAPFAALWSRRDDVTIFGAYGAYERGWAAVAPRLDWAASRYPGGETAYEPLAAGCSGDLGYAIGLERGEARRVEGNVPIVLRVTHLFRLEHGAWKLIHRHADPIAVKTAPEAVLIRSIEHECTVGLAGDEAGHRT